MIRGGLAGDRAGGGSEVDPKNSERVRQGLTSLQGFFPFPPAGHGCDSVSPLEIKKIDQTVYDRARGFRGVDNILKIKK